METKITVRPPFRSGSSKRDLLLLLGTAAGSLAFALATLVNRPDLHRAADFFLFGDAGVNFWVADRLLAGGSLYEDAAFPYGPLPAHLHTAVAALVGNGIPGFYGFFVAATLVNVALATLLIRRAASRLTTVVVVGLGLTASLLVPGSVLGGSVGSTYMPLERTVLLAAALLWQPPGARASGRSAALGAVVASWQLIRFGGAFFLGAAILLADLLALWWTGGLRDRVGPWVRSLLPLFGGAAAVQIALVLWAVATLPWPIARDVLWPMYVVESYAWVVDEVRFPTWGGWRLFLGQYLTPGVGAIAGLWALGWYVRRAGARLEPDPAAPGAIRLLIPLLFYLLASVALFRTAYHYLQFGWALVIPAAWLFERGGRITRTALVAAMLPCFLLNARSAFVGGRVAGVQPFTTASGEELWATPAQQAEYAAAFEAIEAEGSGEAAGATMILPLGAGFHHFYQVPTPLRVTWFLPGMARPYDQAEIVAEADSLDAVFVPAPAENLHPDDPCTWRDPSPLSEEACAAIAGRLARGQQVGRFWVFPLR